MIKSRSEILSEIVAVLEELADDWEYAGEIGEHTMLMGEMGFESLDIVVLATALQERYPQEIPFSEFFAALGEREGGDVSVAEWVDFIAAHTANGVAQ